MGCVHSSEIIKLNDNHEEKTDNNQRNNISNSINNSCIKDKYKKSQKEKIVLNINDISYCAGLYKADIKYVFINSDNTFEVDYDSIESYALTAYFKSNKNNSTDMFSIVKLEENNTK